MSECRTLTEAIVDALTCPQTDPTPEGGPTMDPNLSLAEALSTLLTDVTEAERRATHVVETLCEAELRLCDHSESVRLEHGVAIGEVRDHCLEAISRLRCAGNALTNESVHIAMVG